MKKLVALLVCTGSLFTAMAQPYTSKVWMADNGNGTYKNPVIDADYSDPDAVRVGDDFYLIASSFNHAPGLPILHSKDLVNWTLIGHALQQVTPVDHFKTVRSGGGVWAPAIRFHAGEFYIYYPDPDFGIYVTKAKNILGPWSEPALVQAGKGLIDPCPLWDDNGKVYLVHAYAGSRAGFKSIVVVKELNAAGSQVIGKPVMVYDGHATDPTLEGPKFYKRNGYYYIFAPAGGVPTGWQLVLRSKNVYGPYERKVVMDQGKSIVNGPHQGAWVDTKSGENWFLHFQDKDAYGRVVHLQPMVWKNDWPVIGVDEDGDGKGTPVLVYKKPNVGNVYPKAAPVESDEFNTTQLGLQWQWHANPDEGWAFPTPNGALRMFSVKKADSTAGMWELPNFLGQKFPTESFSATIKLQFQPKFEQERFAFAVHGADYAFVSLVKRNGQLNISYNSCQAADRGKAEKETVLGTTNAKDIYLRITVSAGAVCNFYYSEDGTNFKKAGGDFVAKPGRWVGARVGMFVSRNNTTNDAGYADIDWFRMEKL
ncbi:MAG TPA: glycoside hydrolase 43 family protein [Phnomibacter sp.]|nr:glycoside hydrolase 43 family protein [Phnomibacter sp.]